MAHTHRNLEHKTLTNQPVNQWAKSHHRLKIREVVLLMFDPVPRSGNTEQTLRHVDIFQTLVFSLKLYSEIFQYILRFGHWIECMYLEVDSI